MSTSVQGDLGGPARSRRQREGVVRALENIARARRGRGRPAWLGVRARRLSEYAELFYDLASSDPRADVRAGRVCLHRAAQLLVGQLAAMTGRRDEAAQRFARAVKVSREIKSPPLIAQSEIAWAEMLAKESDGAASEHARAAFEQASLVGMGAVVAQAEKLMKARQPPRTSRCRGDLDVAAACGRGLVARSRRGAVTLVDSKGMKYLEALVLAPHRRCTSRARGDRRRGRRRAAARRKGEAGLPRPRRGAARGARGGDRVNDAGRIERAQRELDDLGTELARRSAWAAAKGGGFAAERARINVQRRLSDAIRRVGEQTPLGRHLELSVKTGLFCMYAPTWPGR